MIEHNLYTHYDSEMDTHDIDDSKLDAYMTSLIDNGPCIVDTHMVDLFDNVFDHVIVLTCDNEILYKRLKKRGYTTAKIQENVQAEIMQVILDSAQFYSNVHSLCSNNNEDLLYNLSFIKQL